jgi:serine/threonine protein kinase
MWALGVIVYQMLTGKHPFHISGDTEEQYIRRISQEPIEQTLTLNLRKYNISELAASFIKRLLARRISDRYRVYQALAHPWITGQLLDEVPPTQNEQHLLMEGEIKLKNAQSILLFLAIAQKGQAIKNKFFKLHMMQKYNPAKE